MAEPLSYPTELCSQILTLNTERWANINQFERTSGMPLMHIEGCAFVQRGGAVGSHDMSFDNIKDAADPQAARKSL